MEQFPRQCRRDPFSFRERRLLGYNKNPEKPGTGKENAKNTENQTPKQEAEIKRKLLAKRLSNVQVVDRPGVIEEFFSEEVNSIDEAAAIEENLRQRGNASADVLEGLSKRKEAIQKSIEERKKLKEKAEQTKKAGKKKGVIDRAADWWNETNLNPMNWSKETGDTMRAAGVGVAIGAAALGTAAFLKWFFVGTKKRVQQAAAKTREGYSVLKYVVAGLVIGGLGYLGFKAASDWMQKSVIGKLQKEADKIRDKLANAKDLSVEEIKKLREDLKGLNAKIAENTPNPDEVLSRVPKRSPAGAPLGEGAGEGEGDRKVDEEADKGLPDVPPEAKEILAGLGYEALARSIVTFHGDIVDWDMEPEAKVTYVNSMLNTNNMQKKTMADIFTAFSGGSFRPGSFDVPAEEEGRTRTNYINAAQLITAYCLENRDKAEKHYENPEDVEALTLDVFLQEVAAGYGAMGTVIRLTKKHKGSLQDALEDEDLDFDRLLADDPSLQKTLSRSIESIEGVDIETLTTALTHPGLGFGNKNMHTLFEVAKAKKPTERSKEEHQIFLLADYLINSDEGTEKFIMPFFHREVPDHVWSDNMEDNLERVRHWWLHDIPSRMAARLFVYSNLIRDENASGIVLMQSEIFKRIRKEDIEKGGFQTRWARVLDSMVKVGLGGTWEEWNETEMDLEFAQKAIEKMGAQSTDIAYAGLNWLFGKFKTAAEFTVGVAQKNKLAAGGAAGTVLTVGGVRFLWKTHRSAQPNQVVRRLDAIVDSRATTVKVISKGQAILISKESALLADSLFDDVMWQMKDLQKIGEKSGSQAAKAMVSEMDTALRNCTTAMVSGPEKAWDDYIKVITEIEAKYSGKVPAKCAEKITEVLDNARMIRNNKSVLYTVLHASRPLKSWVGRIKRGALAPVGWFIEGLKEFPVEGFANIDRSIGAVTEIEKAVIAAQKAGSKVEKLAALSSLLDEGKSVDELMKAGATATDLLEIAGESGAKISADDVMKVVLAAEPDVQTKYLANLLLHGALDSKYANTFTIDDICKAVSTIDPADSRRLQILANLQKTEYNAKALAKYFTLDELTHAKSFGLGKTASLPEAWLLSDEIQKGLAALRSGYEEGSDGLRMFDKALNRISKFESLAAGEALELLMDPNAIRVLGDADDLIKAGTLTADMVDDGITAALKVAGGNKVPVLQRCMAYYAAMGSDLTEELCKPVVLQAIGKWGGADAVFVQRFVTQLRNAAKTVDYASDAAHTAGRISASAATKARKALESADNLAAAIAKGRRAHLLATGGGRFALQMGGELVAVAFDYYAWKEANERVDRAQKDLEKWLTPKNGFTKTTSNGYVVYEHTSGFKVNAAFMKKQLGALDDPEAARLAVSTASAAVTAGGGVLAYAAPSLSFGPAGWVLFGAVIAYHGASLYAQSRSNREFLINTKIPVLAHLGMTGTVGYSEFDALASNSSRGAFDDDNERQGDALVRKKSVSIMFWQEMQRLGKTQPTIVNEVLRMPSGHDQSKTKDATWFLREGSEFFAEDYKKVIEPYVKMRIFQLSNDTSATWHDFREMRVDRGLFDFVNIDEEDLQIALRESAILYVQHLREMRYRRMKSKRAALAVVTGKNKKDQKIASGDQIIFASNQKLEHADLDTQVTIAGSRKVLGVPTASLEYESDDAPTQVQKLLAGMESRLDYNHVQVTYFQSPETGQDEESTYYKQRQNYTESDFAFTMPDHLFPEMKTGRKGVEMWILPYMALDASNEAKPEERKAAFSDALEKLQKNVTPWRKEVKDVHYKQSMDYYILLHTYPEMDPEGHIRSMIQRGPKEKGWVTDTKLTIDTATVGVPKSMDPDWKGTAYLWQLPFLSTLKSPETDPIKKYDSFRTELRSICNRLWSADNPKRRGSYTGDWDQKILFECYALCKKYPEFDDGNKIRNMISGLPKSLWLSHFTQNVHESTIQKAHNMLLAKLREVEGKKYEVHSPRSKQPSLEVYAYPKDQAGKVLNGDLPRGGHGLVIGSHVTPLRFYNTRVDYGHYDLEDKSMNANTKEIWIEVEGKPPKKIEATECLTVDDITKTTHHEKGAGTFICESERFRTESGKEYVTYNWYFKAGTEEGKFYAYHKDKGIEQPGQSIDVTRTPSFDHVVSKNDAVVSIPPVHRGVVSLRVLENGREFTITADLRTQRDKLKKYVDIQQTLDVDKLTNGGIDYDLMAYTMFPKKRDAIVGMTVEDYKERTWNYTFEKEFAPVFSEKVQKMHEAARKNLELSSPKNGLCTRKGYKGKYVLQLDGSVFYTGGEGPRKTYVEPNTYLNGLWLKNLRSPLAAEQTRTVVAAGSAIFLGKNVDARISVQFLGSRDEDNVFNIEEPFRILGSNVPEEFSKYFTIEKHENGYWLKQVDLTPGRLLLKNHDLNTATEFAYGYITKKGYDAWKKEHPQQRWKGTGYSPAMQKKVEQKAESTPSVPETESVQKAA